MFETGGRITKCYNGSKLGLLEQKMQSAVVKVSFAFFDFRANPLNEFNRRELGIVFSGVVFHNS